ncbi:MBL fold metallo-hydrolase [Bacillus testis]|uniref:MBL fold metallo-hydrolase n=1 Tax=Bacillus testis TaxID=1622072 RepID=UPI00067E84F0|nr:MBL fold metallo-hydrolase [Bacillus testis]
MKFAQQINSTMYCIDCHDLGRKNRTGCYVLKGQSQAQLIETSASPSISYILQGLEELNIPLETITHIIVTHIHLDHAGGAGLLLQKCPNAKLLVHPKGERHLIDPARLIAGAKAVYGKDFEALFEPILPIPAHRIETVGNGQQLILDGRTLTFYHTPGHANHHISIHDSVSNGVFTGDTCGIYYQEGQKGTLVLPTTSPNQFNPVDMLNSISLYERLKPDALFFGHFGVCSEPTEAFSQMRHYIPLFVACGTEARKQMPGDAEAQLALIEKLLWDLVSPRLSQLEVSGSHSLQSILKLDFSVSSLGILDMLAKRESKA